MPSTTTPQASYSCRAGVGTQDSAPELACAAVAGLLDDSLDECSTGAVAGSVRVNCQPTEFQQVIVRRERDRLTELGVADDDTVNLGDEHVVGSRLLGEERRANRRCWASETVVVPRGGVHLPENGVVPRTISWNREHRDRMPQRRPITRSRGRPHDDGLSGRSQAKGHDGQEVR
jgi:hypothetical protein